MKPGIKDLYKIILNYTPFHIIDVKATGKMRYFCLEVQLIQSSTILTSLFINNDFNAQKIQISQSSPRIKR